MTTDHTTTSEARRQAGVEQLSSFLLKGYTMMADCCPIPGCNMPMLKSRQDKTSKPFCPNNCVLPVNARGAADHSDVVLPPKATQAETPVTIASLSSDQISRMMGQYLLSGWTMLEETCSTCRQGIPLMRKGAGGEEMCVACSARSKSANAPAHQPTTSSSLQVTEGSVDNGPSPKSSNEISSALGQRLLSGWAMLNDTCTLCNHGVPLMRRGSELLCVVCGPTRMGEYSSSPPSSNHVENVKEDQPRDDIPPTASPLPLTKGDTIKSNHEDTSSYVGGLVAVQQSIGGKLSQLAGMLDVTRCGTEDVEMIVREMNELLDTLAKVNALLGIRPHQS